MDLFYRIKDCWKGREEPTDLLVRPLEPGLSLKIAEWCFDTLFDIEGHSESAQKPYIDTLQPEDLIWFVEEVCQAARLSSYFGDDKLLEAMETQIKTVEALFDTDEEQYWTQISGPARRSLHDNFTRLCGDSPNHTRSSRQAAYLFFAQRQLEGQLEGQERFDTSGKSPVHCHHRRNQMPAPRHRSRDFVCRKQAWPGPANRSEPMRRR
jgi:hypothetical protein